MNCLQINRDDALAAASALKLGRTGQRQRMDEKRPATPVFNEYSDEEAATSDGCWSSSPATEEEDFSNFFLQRAGLIKHAPYVTTPLAAAPDARKWLRRRNKRGSVESGFVSGTGSPATVHRPIKRAVADVDTDEEEDVFLSPLNSEEEFRRGLLNTDNTREDQRENDDDDETSIDYSPWGSKQYPSLSAEPGPRTSFGLIDLDVTSPCCGGQLCLLDKLILEDESRRAAAATDGRRTASTS